MGMEPRALKVFTVSKSIWSKKKKKIKAFLMLEDILLYILACKFISSSLETLAFSKTLQPQEKREWELFRVWHIPGSCEMFNE